jgi:hypothetical protein
MIHRFFSLLLLAQLHLFASQYNSTIIELQAKLFPKILLLSENVNKDSQTLHICILTKENDIHTAQEFKKAIKRYYKEPIMEKTVFVSISRFDEIALYPDGIIVLNHTQEEMLRIANWANANNIVSFSYDPSQLEYGILASLYIGATTKPYLNKKIIKKHGFSLNAYLLKLSKFY